MKAIIFDFKSEVSKKNDSNPWNCMCSALRNRETIFVRQLRIIMESGIKEVVIASNEPETLQAMAAHSQFHSMDISFLHCAPVSTLDFIQQILYVQKQLTEDCLLLFGALVYDRKLIEDMLHDSRKNLVGVYHTLELPKNGYPVTFAGDRICKIDDTWESNAALFPLFKVNTDTLSNWLSQAMGQKGVSGPIGANALDALCAAVFMQGFDCSNHHYLDYVCDTEDLKRVSNEIRQFDCDKQSFFCGSGEQMRILEILTTYQVKHPFLVCSKTAQHSAPYTLLKKMYPNLTVYSGFGYSLSYHDAFTGAKLFKENHCDFILSIGDDNAIDMAKAIKWMSTLAETSPLYDLAFSESSVQHLAVPLPAGGGSESTDYFEMLNNEQWTNIQHDSLLPDFALLDPGLMNHIPLYEKKIGILTALSRAIESIWSLEADEKSKEYALTGGSTIMKQLLAYLNNCTEPINEKILIACNSIGRSTNIAQTTVASAIGRQLAESANLPRGYATARCIPYIWEHMSQHIDRFQKNASIAKIGEAFNLLNKIFGATSTQNAIEQFRFALSFLDSYPQLSSGVDNWNVLASSVDDQSLAHHPVVLQKSEILQAFKSAYDMDNQVDAEEPKTESLNLHELKELQRLELEILLEFDAFCKRNNLTYFLSEGTMLGAIRHNGFIPWDDDVDVMMPRKDYDKMIRISRLDFPLGYHLDSIQTNPKHWVLGAKMQLMRQTKFTQENICGKASFNGPYIDIFPLDSVPRAFSFKQRYQGIKIRVLRRLLFIKTGFSTIMKRKLHRYFLLCLSKFVKTTWIHKQLDHSMRKLSKPKNAYLVNWCSYYPFSKETFRLSFFYPPRLVSFEGHQLPVPAEAWHMLKTIYGKSYNRLPNIDKCKQRHSFQVDRNFKESPQAARKINTIPSPKVSIIVPVYNVEEYLRESLDSLVGQSLEDIEIIVVNDGSPDNSQAIIDKYHAMYPDKLFSHIKENGGLSDARNYGLQYARGEYVAFVDSDDYVDKDMYRLMIGKAEETDADVVVCRINRVEGKKGIVRMQGMEFRNSYGHSFRERPELLIACKPYAWNKIYRKKLFLENQIKYPVKQAFEDSAVTYNLLLMANKIELVDKPLNYYRIDREGSITNTYDEKFFDIFKSCQSIIDFYKSKGVFEHFFSEIRELCRLLVFVRIQNLYYSTNKKLIKDFINEAYSFLDTNCKRWRKSPYNQQIGMRSKRKLDLVQNRKFLLRCFMLMRIRLGLVKEKNISHFSSAVLRKLQLIELDILRTVDKICQEHNLTYYLAEGSLLGAVRHGGFIPWDDDTDIVMPRKDYDRFIEIFGHNTIDDCVMVNEKTYAKYHLTFTKIVTTKQTGFYNTLDPFPEKYLGPFIDIFPLDAGIEHETIKRRKAIRKYRDLLLLKVNYMTPKTFKRVALKVLSPFYSFHYLQSKIQRLYMHYQSDQNPSYLVNFASSYPTYKETVPAKAYEKPLHVSFEGYLFPIPRDADAVLRVIYKNYLELPPPSKRICKHSLYYDKNTDHVRILEEKDQ